MANNLIVYSPAVGRIANTFGSNAVVNKQANQVARKEKSNEEAVKFTKGLVSMVNHLASIDHTLKANLKNIYAKHRIEMQAAREAVIENNTSSGTNGTADAIKAKPSGPSILDIAGMGLIFAAAFDPIKDAAKSIYDYGKAIYERTSSIARSMTSVLTTFNNLAPNLDQYFGGNELDSKQANQVNDEFNKKPWYSQLGIAANDLIRIAANSFTFGYADKLAALTSGEGDTYEERLKSQEQESLRAQERAGLAGTVTSLYGGAKSAGAILKGVKGLRSARATAVPVSGGSKASEAVIDMVRNPKTGVYEAASAAVKPSSGLMAKAAGGALIAGSIVGSNVTEEPKTPNAKPNATTAGELPRNDITALGRYIQRMGLRVSGADAFGGREIGKHATNSAHYDNRAIDINVDSGVDEASDPKWGPIFDRLAQQAQAAGYSVIWRKKDHFNHMHIQVGGKSSVGTNESGDEEGTGLFDFTMAKLGQFASKIKGLTTQDSISKGSMVTSAPDYSIYSRRLSESASKSTADKIEVRTPTKLPESRAVSPPNLNSQPGGTVATHSTTSEGGALLNQYFNYFGVLSAASAAQ